MLRPGSGAPLRVRPSRGLKWMQAVLAGVPNPGKGDWREEGRGCTVHLAFHCLLPLAPRAPHELRQQRVRGVAGAHGGALPAAFPEPLKVPTRIHIPPAQVSVP